MEKQNATTYENMYGLQTHPLLPGTLRRLSAYICRLLSAFPKAQELLKSVMSLKYVDTEGDISQQRISLIF